MRVPLFALCDYHDNNNDIHYTYSAYLYYFAFGGATEFLTITTLSPNSNIWLIEIEIGCIY